MAYQGGSYLWFLLIARQLGVFSAPRTPWLSKVTYIYSHHMQDIYVCKTGTAERSINMHFLAVLSLTYLLTNERGIKCGSVDISSEQSNIMLTPLNWRTRHGAELVLPKEY